MFRTVCALLCFSCLVTAVGATLPGEVANQLAILEKVGPSLVTIEYTLQYDKGDSPPGTVVRYLDSSWSLYHTSSRGATMVQQRRPLEVPGFLISPTRIISRDPTVADRFITSIRVRQGDRTVAARRVAFALDRNAVYLDIASPLEDAQPLAFDSQAAGPYNAIIHTEFGGMWRTAVKPLSASVSVAASGRRSVFVPPYSLIVDSEATPVGMAMSDQLPVDDSWKGSPHQWPQINQSEHEATLKEFEAITERGLLRVTLNFRSPREQDQSGGRFSRRGRGFGRPIGRGREETSARNENITERHAIGLLFDPRRVLILAELRSNVTAHLERIRVFRPNGEAVAAKCVGSLSDYGALIAELDQPMEGELLLSTRSIYEYEQRLLVKASVQVRGEERTAELYHDRIIAFGLGWRRQVYPAATSGGRKSFLFDRDGKLVALPISQRLPLSATQRPSQLAPRLTSARYLAKVLDELDEHLDPYNVPLSEEDTSRVAWLGVVLQPLDRQLARANRVAEQTRDGRIGALVTYVYADSPAARAGIEPGTILLRLHVEDQIRPLDVRVVEDRFGSIPFPWDRLDELPEQVLDRLPKPWPSVENDFTRMLTELGFGTRFAAEMIVNGQPARQDFVVTPSPPHFDAAPQYQSSDLGITVRDVTYEVRRQLQLGPDDPGVIISKIEAGSKASVAGIRPFEIITHIHGQPVHDVKLFETYTTDTEELELSVKRMTRSRQVRIN